MKVLKQLFCNHLYLRKVSIMSERKGFDNYIYDCDHFKCEKCGYHYSTKTLNRIDKGYYPNKSVRLAP